MVKTDGRQQLPFDVAAVSTSSLDAFLRKAFPSNFFLSDEVKNDAEVNVIHLRW